MPKRDRFVLQLWSTMHAEAQVALAVERSRHEVLARQAGEELTAALASADVLQADNDALRG